MATMVSSMATICSSCDISPVCTTSWKGKDRADYLAAAVAAIKAARALGRTPLSATDARRCRRSSRLQSRDGALTAVAITTTTRPAPLDPLGHDRAMAIRPAPSQTRREHLTGDLAVELAPAGSARGAFVIRHRDGAGAPARAAGRGMTAAQQAPHATRFVRSKLGVRWARWTARRRAPILWSALLVAIAATPIAARLPLRGDMSYLLPPETQSVRDLHALEARAQVFGTIIVAIESDDAARRATAARWCGLAWPRSHPAPCSASRPTARPAIASRGITAICWCRPRTSPRFGTSSRSARRGLNPLFVALDDDEPAARTNRGRALEIACGT